MKTYRVYKHTCPNNKVYIGITSVKYLSDRWASGNGYKRCPFFYRAIQKYGWENIKHEILFEGLTTDEASQKEIELVAQYQSTDPEFGYNISPGGNLKSEQTNKKISNTLMGHPGAFAGKTHTAEAKEKDKQSHLGKRHTKETKEKCRQASKGNTYLHDFVVNGGKLTAWNAGIPKYKVAQYTLAGELVMIFESVTVAAAATGFAKDNLIKCLNGHRRTSYNFI